MRDKNSETPFPRHIEDLVGTKRCRLSINSLERENGCIFLLCTCDCGTRVKRTYGNLMQHTNSSCGCWTKENSAVKTHGQSKSLVYGQWCGMVARCHRKTHYGYYKYGSKGVTVCDNWRNSFEAFRDDMGPKPDGGTIGRIDNAKGYCPENCRWESTKEQAINRTDNRLIEFQGKTLCLKQWSDLTGIGENTITSRLKMGWTVEDSLTKPISRSVRRNSVYAEFNGQQRLLADISKETGLSCRAIYQRIKKGKSLSAPYGERKIKKLQVINE